MSLEHCVKRGVSGMMYEESRQAQCKDLGGEQGAGGEGEVTEVRRPAGDLQSSPPMGHMTGQNAGTMTNERCSFVEHE